MILHSANNTQNKQTKNLVLFLLRQDTCVLEFLSLPRARKEESQYTSEPRGAIEEIFKKMGFAFGGFCFCFFLFGWVFSGKLIKHLI